MDRTLEVCMKSSQRCMSFRDFLVKIGRMPFLAFKGRKETIRDVPEQLKALGKEECGWFTCACMQACG